MATMCVYFMNVYICTYVNLCICIYVYTMSIIRLEHSFLREISRQGEPWGNISGAKSLGNIGLTDYGNLTLNFCYPVKHD